MEWKNKSLQNYTWTLSLSAHHLILPSKIFLLKSLQLLTGLAKIYTASLHKFKQKINCLLFYQFRSQTEREEVQQILHPCVFASEVDMLLKEII